MMKKKEKRIRHLLIALCELLTLPHGFLNKAVMYR